MYKPLTVRNIIDLLHKNFGNDLHYNCKSVYSNPNYCICLINHKKAVVTVIFNSKNQTLSVAVDKNLSKQNEILNDFSNIFDNVMQRPYLCKFDDKIEGNKKAISVVQWCNNELIAEIMLKAFIQRARQSEGGINNLEYNKNYGETKFNLMFQNFNSPEQAY